MRLLWPRVLLAVIDGLAVCRAPPWASIRSGAAPRAAAGPSPARLLFFSFARSSASPSTHSYSLHFHGARALYNARLATQVEDSSSPSRNPSSAQSCGKNRLGLSRTLLCSGGCARACARTSRGASSLRSASPSSPSLPDPDDDGARDASHPRGRRFARKRQFSSRCAGGVDKVAHPSAAFAASRSLAPPMNSTLGSDQRPLSFIGSKPFRGFSFLAKLLLNLNVYLL